MIAFSTNWNAGRERDGAKLVQEILDLGFNTIELGHGLSVSQLHGIRELRAKARFDVLSVHNYCPMPVEILTDNPDCYELSSYRQTDRERAVKLTRQTMATAVEFGARYVVLHLGRITPLTGMTDSLLDLVQKKGVASKQYARLKLSSVQKREHAARVYLQRVESLLAPLVEEAAQLGLVLGIENRSDFEAMPTERELLELLQRFNTPHLRYWHDFGHAQMRENLGLLDHAQWLEKIAPYAAGAHLQDARWPDVDHLIPFEGEIPFDRLVPLLPSSLPFILELSSRSKPAAILASVDRWRSRFPLHS
jgi:sugar phosphate isomerase/epimerase